MDGIASPANAFYEVEKRLLHLGRFTLYRSGICLLLKPRTIRQNTRQKI